MSHKVTELLKEKIKKATHKIFVFVREYIWNIHIAIDKLFHVLKTHKSSKLAENTFFDTFA